ncbi:TraR/DksA family transcriptional regulator [Spiribacter sp. 218]|uniref:TraR/DksA family transcriptional regulator n=1 Tax=Spiribacter pallidus TaxID=1987936 RepID=UPI00349FB5ED
MESHLDAAQRDRLRQMLEAQRATLRETLRGEVLAADIHRAEDIADRVRDPGDEAVVDLLADLEYADIDRHIGALRATEAALRAWHDGRYGVCADCGGPIPYARLEAYPTASRCIDCQAEYERAGGPTPRL